MLWLLSRHSFLSYTSLLIFIRWIEEYQWKKINKGVRGKNLSLNSTTLYLLGGMDYGIWNFFYFFILKETVGGFATSIHLSKGWKDLYRQFNLSWPPSCDLPATWIKLRTCRIKYGPKIHPQSLGHLVVVEFGTLMLSILVVLYTLNSCICELNDASHFTLYKFLLQLFNQVPTWIKV